MKYILLTCLFLTASLFAEDSVAPLSLEDERISIEEKENWIYLSLETQTTAGQRLIYAWPNQRTGRKEVYLDYYFIQNIKWSYRHLEPVTVTWKIMKMDWEKWKTNKTIFIRKKENVSLTPEQVKDIKEDWKP